MIWKSKNGREWHVHDMATEHIINALAMLWRVLVQRELGVVVPETLEHKHKDTDQIHEQMRTLHAELLYRRSRIVRDL